MQACADGDGAVSPLLYKPLRMVAETWRGEQQEVEGMANMIQMAVKQCPNIQQPLIDARVGTRKAARLGSRKDARKKWSDLKGTFESLLDDAVSHHRCAGEVMAKLDRFGVPRASVANVPYRPLPPITDAPKGDVQEWAHRASLCWLAASNRGAQPSHCSIFGDCSISGVVRCSIANSFTV